MQHPILKRTALILAAAAALASSACSTSTVKNASTPNSPGGAKAGDQLILKNLMSAELGGVEGTEVIVSHVTIPPNTSLPKHWHPGEEFAYVLEGSVTLWQKGKRKITGRKGDAMKVPLKQIHTAITGDEGVKLLIFRVHEQGQPERVLVD